jgi:hypothetical protein
MERFKYWLVTYPDGNEATLYYGKGFVHLPKGQVLLWSERRPEPRESGNAVRLVAKVGNCTATEFFFGFPSRKYHV